MGGEGSEKSRLRILSLKVSHPWGDWLGFLFQRNRPCILGFLFEEQYDYGKGQEHHADLKWQVLSPSRNLDAELKLDSIYMPFSSPFNMSFFRTGNFFKWGRLADWTLFFHLTTYLPCLMRRNAWYWFHTCLCSSKSSFLLALRLCSSISLFKWRTILLSHWYDI